MFFEEGDIELLTQLGFTKTQALLYWNILELGEVDVATLAKKANLPRSQTYRTLDELQTMGLAEKELASPNKFRGIPIEDGLQILLIKHFHEQEELQVKTKKLLRKIQGWQITASTREEPNFIIIKGRERILQDIKHSHDNVQRSVDIISTLPRWLQIVQECFESYVRALDRKVKYRVILEKTEGEISLPENVASLLERSNFELRLSPALLNVNLGVFDQNEATLNYLPSISLKESPIIWTNHSGFISICHVYFNSIWKSAERYQLKKAS